MGTTRTPTAGKKRTDKHTNKALLLMPLLLHSAHAQASKTSLKRIKYRTRAQNCRTTSRRVDLRKKGDALAEGASGDRWGRRG